MKITLKLTQAELNQAITEFVKTQGLDIEGKQLSIDIIAGRKGNPDYANIEIDESVPVTPVSDISAVSDIAANTALNDATEDPDEAPLADLVEPAKTKPIDDVAPIFS